MMSEKTIAFRIDEDLHKKIKMRLIETNKTLKDYVIDLIKIDLAVAQSTQNLKGEVVNIDMKEFFSMLADYVIQKQAEQSDDE